MLGTLNNWLVCGYQDMHIKAKPSCIVDTFAAWCHSISQAFNWQGIAPKWNQTRARNRDLIEGRYRNKSFPLSRYAIEYFIITILRVYKYRVWRGVLASSVRHYITAYIIISYASNKWQLPNDVRGFEILHSVHLIWAHDLLQRTQICSLPYLCSQETLLLQITPQHS